MCPTAFGGLWGPKDSVPVTPPGSFIPSFLPLQTFIEMIIKKEHDSSAEHTTHFSDILGLHGWRLSAF